MKHITNGTIRQSEEVVVVFDSGLEILRQKAPKRVLAPQMVMDLRLCFVEAVANAIVHAKELESPGFVTTRLFMDERNIGFEVVDHGVGFDLEKVPAPDLDNPRSSGRGVFMMKQLADSVRYRMRKNENVLTVKIPLAGSGSTRELDLLYDLSEAILGQTSLEKIYETILDQALAIFHVERASILVYDDKFKRLRVVASRGMPVDIREKTNIRKGEGVSGFVFQHGRPMLITDIDEDRRGLQKRQTYKSRSFISAPMICSPMRVGERAMGVINLTDRIDKKKFSRKDLKLLSTIANHAMACVHMRDLVEKVKDSESLRREMEAARRIQASYLPIRPPSVEGIDLAGRCEMAQSVGGDYFDMIKKGNSLFVAIADVSGHDLTSALSMVNFRAHLRATIMHETDPGRILTLVNRSLYDDLRRADQFVTALIARIDLPSGHMILANAGHYPPLMHPFHQDTGEIGLVLGVDAGEEYISSHLDLMPSETILFHTDGVSECMNRQGLVFGRQRVSDFLSQYASQSCSELVDDLVSEVLQFRTERRPLDDVTVVALRFKGDA